MFIDKDGEVFEHTYTSPDGSVIIHHHGTTRLTPEQNERFSIIMSRAWDNLPEHVKDELYEKKKVKYKLVGTNG